MIHTNETTDHPFRSWIQIASWLGVGIWTVAFGFTYLQLWLQRPPI